MKRIKWLRLGIALLLLVLIGYGIYKFIHRPYMTLIIKYREVSPVITGIIRRGMPDIYYRGYQVGKISKIDLSKDQQYIVFYANISYKNLKLPKNITIELGSEDLYGTRHFIFYYPDIPSKELLTNGDVLYGCISNDRLDKYLVQELKQGRLGKLIDNSLLITNAITPQVQNLSKLTKQKEYQDLMNQLPQTVNSTVYGIQSLNTSMPVVNRSINRADIEIGRANRNISQANINISGANENISAANINISTANKIISHTNEVIPRTNEAINTTNCLLDATNINLSQVNAKIPEIPPELLENANDMLIKADCLIDETVDALDQRFLPFKFLFGSPLSSLKKCTQGDNYCPYNPENELNKQY